MVIVKFYVESSSDSILFLTWNESGFPRWLGPGVRSEVQEDLRLCLKQFLVLSF